MAVVTPDTYNKNVRKWRQVILGVSDWGDANTPLPATLGDVFNMVESTTDAGGAVIQTPANVLYTPKSLAAGVRDMGYITTDGVTDTKDVKSEGVDMLQSLEPVRTDITGMEKTLAVTFGEQNAWTNAMRAGLPVIDWPALKNSGFVFSDGQIADFPYYTLWMLMQDGVGPSANYRFELFPKAKVTGMEGRKRNASDAEVMGFTFGLFRDDTIGKSHIIAQEGPNFEAHQDATLALY